MYSGPRLIELLEKQHQLREAKLLPSGKSQSGLFKKGKFTLLWRAKVGSFPHPDLETMVSAGEPCGAWRPIGGRPEDKRNVGQNWDQLKLLPLNGYIPGASIRGIVRAWAQQRPEITAKMHDLLGYQKNDIIKAGKIEFFDAWPSQPTKLSLDIVNPQESFQVCHQGQTTPLSFYTLGNGEDEITVTVAIRGIPGRATNEEVEEVWEWVQQALSAYGVGSRTASGYGTVRASNSVKPEANPGYAVKQFEFSLYSQGSAGPNMASMELRPSHWRGWLRSWVLRFFLGVMSLKDAQKTVGELFGTLEPESRKGCVRLQMFKGSTWCDRSTNQPSFYQWKGKLQISAPSEILSKIILPIIRFAVMVGGVGRGWRRPLHIFHMNNGKAASRGTYLTLTHKVKNKTTNQWENKPYGLALDVNIWQNAYSEWLAAVQNRWSDRVTLDNHNIAAEVFSPTTCAIYAVPGPDTDPLELQQNCWDSQQDAEATRGNGHIRAISHLYCPKHSQQDAEATRGDGVYLIYQQKAPRNYKRNPELGGNAGSGTAHCSWVTIKRVKIPNKQEETNCQEIVCLFMGGQTPNSNHVRSRFLRDLNNLTSAVHLFGLKPPVN